MLMAEAPACSEQLPRRRSSAFLQFQGENEGVLSTAVRRGAAVAEAQHVAAPRLARSPAELCPRQGSCITDWGAV